MAQFKKVTHTYIDRKICEFWGNMVKNLDEPVRDSDFFSPVANALPHDKVVSLVLAAFEDEELDEMTSAHERRARLDLDDSADEILASLWNNRKYTRKTRLVAGKIAEIFQRGLSKDSEPDPVEQRVRELQRVLKLSDTEREIMLFAYLKRECNLDCPRRVDNAEKPVFYAMALDVSHGEILKAMDASGKLRKYEVLDDDWDFNFRAYSGFLCGAADEAIERHFYRKMEGEALPWDFYGSLAATDGEILRKLLNARKGRLNILLYGAPGTGKTSFARTLAAETGYTPYEIRQGDEEGRNMNSKSRLAGIQICNDQIDPSDSMMVIDEADGLLRGNSSMFAILFGGSSASTEKGIVNSLLDDIKVPAIWISNAPAWQMDESVRRRFDYSVCFEKLNTAQREAIWRNCIAKFELGDLIHDDAVPELASKYIVSAGGISMVLENLRRLNPAPEEVGKTIATLMKSHCKLMGTDKSDKFLPVREYSLEGLNVKSQIPLEKIEASVRRYADAIESADNDDFPRMNILLHGVPGSGKTEWVKHLGKMLGKRVVVKMGSDILDKYVGGTEKNISQAFAEAEAEGAILFFDEVDSLLQDRRGAHASWEVSQVNELLHDMEESKVILVCATNFLESLDQAVLRRFSFKIEFAPLENSGKKIFFEKVFKSELTADEEKELFSIPNLTPGDFRAVKESLRFVADDATTADRIAALREEVRLKPDTKSSSHVGF
ncbi:MAG: ATP-binding protein [Kiritimatiellae bacterium]|nr:ATP-binding protein [Kiritimatiellia bacterium]